MAMRKLKKCKPTRFMAETSHYDKDLADYAVLFIEQLCHTLNGRNAEKDGFFQYSAAWDSKHIVTLEEGRSARLLFSMQEMEDGGVLL